MRRLTLLSIGLLAACSSLPRGEPLTAADHADLRGALETWVAHGYPKPDGDCGHNGIIVRTDVEQMREVCGGPPCRTGERPCKDGCLRWKGRSPPRRGERFGRPIPIYYVDEEQPHESWLHEGLHAIEACAIRQHKMASRLRHGDFDVVLHEVENAR